MLDTTKPRTTGRAAIKASVPKELWDKNHKFTDELVATINAHRLMQHPLKQVLVSEGGAIGAVRTLHLEFRHAFAQIFTDSIAHAMVTSAQLEPRLGPLGKASARFLLQLNLLDELGFVPGEAGTEEYSGHPELAHYLQFAATLKQLGIADADIAKFKPTPAAVAARATFEDTYKNHVLLVSVLAAAETTFSDFAGPWAQNTGKTQAVNVKAGYHAIHVEQDDGAFVDDEHSEDSWYLVRQALEPKDYPTVKAALNQWLTTWASFADSLVKTATAG